MHLCTNKIEVIMQHDYHLLALYIGGVGRHKIMWYICLQVHGYLFRAIMIYITGVRYACDRRRTSN